MTKSILYRPLSMWDEYDEKTWVDIDITDDGDIFVGLSTDTLTKREFEMLVISLNDAWKKIVEDGSVK